MDGIVIETTVTEPLTGATIIGQSVMDILPPADAVKYTNALFKAVTKNEHQWTDYTVMGETFVALVELMQGTEYFVAHETPYSGTLKDIRTRLVAALNNFRKMKK